jgi:hypothetical protein
MAFGSPVVFGWTTASYKVSERLYNKSVIIGSSLVDQTKSKESYQFLATENFKSLTCHC